MDAYAINFVQLGDRCGFISNKAAAATDNKPLLTKLVYVVIVIKNILNSFSEKFKAPIPWLLLLRHFSPNFYISGRILFIFTFIYI